MGHNPDKPVEWLRATLFRNRFFPHSFAIFLFLPFVALVSQTVSTPAGVGVDQKIGASLPMEMTFVDEQGQVRPLGSFFLPGRPVLIAPAYFECAQLCTQVFNQLVRVVRQTRGLKPGTDYVILSLSINSEDSPGMAHEKGENYRSATQRDVTPTGWQFLTAGPETLRHFTEVTGYRYIRQGKDFAHPAVLLLLTPEGKISRYLPGPGLEPGDFRLSLVEASEGRTGSPMDTVMLTCFRYDSATGRYAPYAMGFIRLGGIAVLALLLTVVISLRLRERRLHREERNR